MVLSSSHKDLTVCLNVRFLAQRWDLYEAPFWARLEGSTQVRQFPLRLPHCRGRMQSGARAQCSPAVVLCPCIGCSFPPVRFQHQFNFYFHTASPSLTQTPFCEEECMCLRNAEGICGFPYFWVPHHWPLTANISSHIHWGLEKDHPGKVEFPLAFSPAGRVCLASPCVVL